MSGAKPLREHNLKPIARIVGLTVTAGDPVVMLEEPINATLRALTKAGMKIGDIDLYEVNEAFAQRKRRSIRYEHNIVVSPGWPQTGRPTRTRHVVPGPSFVVR